MKLTIDQAAAHLGKSARQVRYLIKNGRLNAVKDGKRWLIDSDDLPLSEARHQFVDRKERQLRAAVEEGLGLDPEGKKPRFSLRDIKAYQIGMPLRRRCAELLGDEHRATRALSRSLELLAIGCHRYRHADKAAAYGEARDYASRALFALFLDGTPDAEAIAVEIEQQLMAPFAGLLHRLEDKHRHD